MTSTSVPIIREAGQGETIYLSETWYQIWKVTGENTKGAADIWLEVVPPQMGPPEHLHASYDEGFLVVRSVARRDLVVSSISGLKLCSHSCCSRSVNGPAAASHQ